MKKFQPLCYFKTTILFFTLCLFQNSFGQVTVKPDSASFQKVTIHDQLENNGLKYPLSDGTSGQILSTDGAGNLSWSDASSTSDFTSFYEYSCSTTPVEVSIDTIGFTSAECGTLYDSGGAIGNYANDENESISIGAQSNALYTRVILQSLEIEDNRDTLFIADHVYFNDISTPDTILFDASLNINIRFVSDEAVNDAGFVITWDRYLYKEGNSLNSSMLGFFFNAEKSAIGGGVEQDSAWSKIGEKSLLFGYGSKAIGDLSSAVGYFNNATGDRSSALGYFNEATDFWSSAVGYDNEASAGSSAFGLRNNATGTYSSAFGASNDATGRNSSAFGYNNIATGDQSSAFGYGTFSDVFGLMAVGRWNVDPVGSATTWEATEPVFVVGNGENIISRSTALTILKNGKVGIGDETPDELLEVAGNVKATNFIGDGSMLTNINVEDADADPNNEIQNLSSVLTQGNDANNSLITNLANPSNPQDAATKSYVDSNDEVNDADADPNNEIQNLSSVLTQGNDANNSLITNLANPSNPQDAATKSYVDSNDEVNDADADPNNEIQDLSLSGDTLNLSDDATAVDLSAFLNNWTIADGRDAVFGYNNLAAGDSSSAVGYNNVANNTFSNAFGSFNDATGERSSAFGYVNEATENESSAFGYANEATGTRSNAFGYENDATGNFSSAFGYRNNATGNGSSAFGYINLATGTNSSALGYGTRSDVLGLMAVGYHNADPDGSATTWVDTDPVFVIGNGENGGNRSTALTILKNGKVGIGDETPDELLEVAGNVKATNFIGDGSMLTNIATQDLSLSGDTLNLSDDATAVDLSAFLNNWMITDGRDAAFGYNNVATGDSSIAVGYNNTATNTYSNAFGYTNDATGARSSAVGYFNDAIGTNSSAFGYGTFSDVYGLMAVGIHNANPDGSATTWVDTDPVFVIGNGENGSNRSTALTILKNGKVGIGTSTPSAKLDVNGDMNLFSGNSYKIGNLQTLLMLPVQQNLYVGNGGTISTGIQNSFVGYNAGISNNTGNSNTFLGYGAGQYNTTGQRNVFIGRFAGVTSTTTTGSDIGENNTFVGDLAGGNNTTGSLNTTLGRRANVSTGNLNTATAIGAESVVNASNKMQLGASTTTLSTSGGYTIVSDGRFKKEVKNDIEGLDFIMNLKPVSYHFDYQQYDDFLRGEKGSKDLSENYKQKLKEKTKKRELGFIAQEVANTADELDIPFNGVYRPQNETDNYALDYGRLSVPLVKAVQEQQAQIEEKNELLKAQSEQIEAQSEQIQALEARLAKIEALLSGKVENISTTTSTLTSATLSQNAPNPFDEVTRIDYFIPEGVKNASLQVMDQNGRIIKRIPIQATGEGQITLQANLLSAGTYSYSLVLDGQVMETKQMVLTH